MNVKDLNVINTLIEQIGVDMKDISKRIDEIERRQQRDIADQWKMISELRVEYERIDLNQKNGQ